MSYRQTLAYAQAKANADRQRAAQRGTRGTLDNVGKNPLKLRARAFHACEAI
jgi:hypothetical protein